MPFYFPIPDSTQRTKHFSQASPASVRASVRATSFLAGRQPLDHSQQGLSAAASTTKATTEALLALGLEARAPRAHLKALAQLLLTSLSLLLSR